MNKKLIVINGTMGVGKSSISSKLSKELENSVLLDGDWCWMMNPWKVTEENKKMVEENIIFLLNQFLKNSLFNHVIFTWVMHDENIWHRLHKNLKTKNISIVRFSLICESEQLKKQMKKDKRTEENIAEAIKRIPMYEHQDTIKINTTNKSVGGIVNEIKLIIIQK
ncbi:AAA family ATPase [Patescibacteria group bacterium]|nr:AAA family ATPase [Patescibacteria group bacterium]